MPDETPSIAQIPLNRVALVVGVTGQRDIATGTEAQLKAAFDAILDELAALYSRLPIVVMTSLAAGAEMLAAEAAAARGLPLMAALPKPPEELERDLTSDPDRERFGALLSRCARVTVASNQTEDQRRFFETAMYVAHYSHLVVAFWDGEHGPAGGVVADVVNVRLSGVTADRSALDDIPYMPDVGPVFQVVTPREGASEPAEASKIKKLYPLDFAGEDGQRDFAAALRCLDVYNADLARTDDNPAFTPTMEGLQNRTDATADRLQRTTYGFLYVLYAVAIIAVILQYFTSQIAKYAALAGAFVVYRLARAKDYENRFQDYRALSEGLRVQLAWKSAGLNDQVEQCYLGRQQADLQWIRMALRYAFLAFVPEVVAGARVTSPGTTEWIEGQCRFFTSAPKKQARSLERLRVATRVFFFVCIATTVVTAGILYLPGLLAHAPAFITNLGLRYAVDSFWAHVPAPRHEWVHSLLARLSTGAVTIYAAVAFLVSNYCDKRAFAQNIKRYKRMIVVFRRAQGRLAEMGEATANSPAGERVVRELGEEALVENADWLLNRRERPLSFVVR